MQGRLSDFSRVLRPNPANPTASGSGLLCRSVLSPLAPSRPPRDPSRSFTVTDDSPRASGSAPRLGRYKWAAAGDVNAFFGLMLDNLGDMILMAGLLVGAYGFPAEFVLSRMIPGTAVGVLVGDLIYTAMAFRLAKKEGRSDVTAMPLGLDTPSTFGAVFLILGPAFVNAKAPLASGGLGLDADGAAQHAWYLGIAMLLASGVFKVLCAFGSGAIRRVVPRAGLLGSLVAIALVLISFLPLLDIAATPVAGFSALAVILVTLTAHRELPGSASAAIAAAGLGFSAAAALGITPGGEGGLPVLGWPLAIGVGVVVGAVGFRILRGIGQVPGALMAVAIGASAFYGLHLVGFGPGPGPRPGGGLGFALPMPMGSWWEWIGVEAHWRQAVNFLPVAIPLALATVVGGIDCAESAAAAGDDYHTGTIVGVEGLATLVAGAFGGVIQSTPYIGHPAYKAMGGRAAYTLATALFVGAAGVFGFFGWFFALLPKAAVFPILVFVGLEISSQSFRATPRRHYPALIFACVPALAYLAYLQVDRLAVAVDALPDGGVPAFARLGPEVQEWLQTLTALSGGGGFLIAGLLWGTMLSKLIDGRMRTAAFAAVVGAAFALFGVIHSPLRSGPILPPWEVQARLRDQGRAAASRWQSPYHWAGAYVGMATVFLALGAGGRPARKPEGDGEVELGMEVAD